MSCNSFNYTGCFAVSVGFDYTMSLIDTGDDEQPTDFTGFDFEMIIQDKDGNDLLTLSVVSDLVSTGIYLPDPTNGELFIQIRKADSIVVGKGDRVYNIRITDPFLNEDIFAYGAISFIEVS